MFQDDADTLVKDAIRKPPEHLSGFGVVAEAVMVACGIVLPEIGVAEEIVEALKGAYEVAKASDELVEKANQEVVANSVVSCRSFRHPQGVHRVGGSVTCVRCCSLWRLIR